MSENNSITTNNNDNLNKNDIIKAKREARRRRILDNAVSRLEKLNGRPNYPLSQQNGSIKKTTTTTNTTTNDQISNPEIEFGSTSLDNLLLNKNNYQNFNGNINDTEDFLKLINQFSKLTENRYDDVTITSGSTSLSSSTYSDLSRNNDLNLQNSQELLSSLMPTPPSSSSTTTTTTTTTSSSLSSLQSPLPDIIVKILNFRLHLMIFAFLTYILNYYLNDSNAYSIFLPFLILELIEVPLFKNTININKSPNSFIDIALLLGGISPNRSQIAFKFMNIIVKILKDISYFIFFFTLYHLIINIFTQNNQIQNEQININYEINHNEM